MSMSAGQLRGVIFDMDGVLVDSHAAHRKAWRLFFETLGREVPECELDFILDGRKRGDILRHFLGDCPDSELEELGRVGSSRVDLQACKLEYSIVSPK